MPPSKESAADRAAGRVLTRIRQMIVSGELLPGQPIRQEAMAAGLGVSRLPVREALGQLVAEGLVCHELNVGFAVTRLSRAEFDQVYLMRELLETAVLRSLRGPEPAQLAEIVLLVEDVERAAAELHLGRMREANSRFHMAVFQMSELNLVVEEISRIWTWALPYHSVYLYSEEGRARILAEHRKMLAALEKGDVERLVQITDEHRGASEAQLHLTLAAGKATSSSTWAV